MDRCASILAVASQALRQANDERERVCLSKDSKNPVRRTKYGARNLMRYNAALITPINRSTSSAS